MKALLCKEFGPPESLVIEDVPSLEATPGMVVIDVKASSVNFPDALMIQGKYQFRPPFPFSPGAEVSGIVKAVGKNVDHVKPGDRVLATPGFGGFAEEVSAPAEVVIPIPDGIDFDSAAAFMFTYGTSQYALVERGRLQSGQTLVVLGAAGGVGLAAVEIGVLLGARVIAAASTDEKLALCRERGASETINYTTEDLKERIKTLTGGDGADVIYDPVGDKYAEPALRAIGWEGRYLVVGFAGGEVPKIPLNLTLLKGCEIVGVFWGDFMRRQPDLHRKLVGELLEWLRDGKVRPHVSEIYPLERAHEAIAAISERKALGKLVVRMDEADA
jgi:NADPH2:quinone reductase